MALGDVLEWLAGICLVIATYLWGGFAPALAAAFLFLFYEGQCYAHVAVKPSFRRKKESE